jgi:hypothetical protein
MGAAGACHRPGPGFGSIGHFGASFVGCPKTLPPSWPQITDSRAGEIYGYRYPQTDVLGHLSSDNRLTVHLEGAIGIEN